MSNKYRLEGEARSFSLGGIGRLLSDLVVIVLAIYIVLQIDEWNKTKEVESQRKTSLNQHIELAKSEKEAIESSYSKNSSQLLLFHYLMETANRQVGSDTLRMAMKELLNTYDYSSTLNISTNLNPLLSNQINQNLSQATLLSKTIEDAQAIQRRLIEEKIDTFLLRKQVLSLIEPYEDLEEVNISELQVDRIIRVLLNDREFIDLIYLRISRLKSILTASEELKMSLMMLTDNLSRELNKSRD